MKQWIGATVNRAALVMIGTLIVLCGCVATSATDCPPPRKPGRVPEEAVWKGDCDGGNWVELVASRGKKMRFRIYEARRGKLLLDADFEHRDCRRWQLTESNWAEHVQSFGYALELVPESDTTRGPRCRLEPVYPAYQPAE